MSLPTKLEIEITNTCNLKCLTCRRGRSDYTQPITKIMTLDEFEYILKQFPTLELLQFCGEAENTLNPNLPEMIELANEYGVEWIEMFTNGTTLTPQLAQRLSKTPLSMIKFSIDGTKESTYREIRGADLEKVLSNIEYFRTLTDIPFAIEMVVSSKNINEIQEAPKMASRVGASTLELRLLSWVVDGFEDFRVDDKQLEEVISKVQEECKKKNINLVYSSPKDCQKDDCLMKEWINIDAQGYITFCYYRDMGRVENVFKKPLSEIWNDPGLVKKREAFIKGDFDLECCCPRSVYSKL